MSFKPADIRLIAAYPLVFISKSANFDTSILSNILGYVNMSNFFYEVIIMGYILTCDDGEFYFDDIDKAIEYGEQNCPCGYNIDEVFD